MVMWNVVSTEDVSWECLVAAAIEFCEWHEHFTVAC